MSFFSLMFIALALAMDAFAVALAAGVVLHPVSNASCFGSVSTSDCFRR